MTFIADIHIHPHNFIPQPIRSVYRFINRKTQPKPFKLHEMRVLPINLAITNAVGDSIVTNLYLGGAYHSVKIQLKKILRQIKGFNGILFHDYSSLEEGLETGKSVVILAVEGGDFLNHRLERLKEIYDLGVRALTLVHSADNCIGHSTVKLSQLLVSKSKTFKKKEGGLTAFGKQIIEEMNSLGMFIDLAHSNEETAFQVLEYSTDPVMATHTGALSLQPSFPRYISDNLLKAIIDNKGLIGVWPFYLGDFGCKDIETLIQHIKHITELNGSENIAIGTDINGIPGIAQGFTYPQGFLTLKELLLKQSFNSEQIEGLLGKNSLNYLQRFKN
ncbi:MAG: dipeptidase [Candidatus Heimdallarchaeaceae archaeon]